MNKFIKKVFENNNGKMVDLLEKSIANTDEALRINAELIKMNKEILEKMAALWMKLG